MTGKIAVGGITRVDGLVLVRILGAEAGRGLVGRALSALGLKGINLNCVTASRDAQGLTNLSFGIHANDLDQTLGILQSLQEDSRRHHDLRARLHVRSPSTVRISANVRRIAGTVFDTTADAGVQIHC
jgi:aspartokinase